MPPGRALLSSDTSAEAEAEQLRIWRALSAVERAELIRAACHGARTLAFAGLAERFPEANDAELLRRYAELTLGEALAEKVYPR
jgi:hypothetical protein